MTGVKDAEAALAALPVAPPLSQQPPPEITTIATLPRDHPQWVRDTVSISSRAKMLLARLRPIAIRVMTFWDHALRTLPLHGQTLSVDPSGSYRLD